MMKRFIYFILLASLGLIAFSELGCRKNELEPKSEDVGYAYFPVEIGNTWIYQVDSIHFDAFGKTIDTFSFLVKHAVVDTFLDNSGVRGSIVDVFRTDSVDGSFNFERTLTKRIVDFRAEILDSNVRVINLVFPPTLYKFWDANVYNTKTKEEYEILEVLESDVIGAQTYKNTIHIVQRDESFKTLRNYGIEKYAKHIGLVYSNQIHWVKKTIGDSTEIPSGFDYTYTLKTFER
ncbi:MAG: hypothetical protein ACI9JN_001562 [Bacteroidia bacterium]|jgi:hypothetical protein